MRFSLQQMVRSAVEEADRRTKLAEAEAAGTKEGEGESYKGKRSPETPPTNKATTPERNETSMDVDKDKTSAAFVEKLASAVEYLNGYIFKGAEATNLQRPPGGGGKQSYVFGQAETGIPPKHPGNDPKSPGQTNPATAMETNINNPPGGKESWEDEGKLRQKSASVVHRLRTTLSKMAEDIEEHEKKESPKVEKAEEAAKKKIEKMEEKKASIARVFGVMKKMAGEDVSPAHIAAAHHDNPPDSSKSEERVPAQPRETAWQRAMVGSNQAAIDYTKGQAKAVPKARMGEVIGEPAQKKSTDPVLQQNLDAAGKAGVKISSAKTAAARALLQKIAEEGAKPDATPEEKERAEKLQAALEAKKKEKQSQAFGMQYGGEGAGTSPIGGGF